MTVPVGIALGSNLGDRQAELDAGVAFIRSWSHGMQLREGPRIKTAAVDSPPGSPPFLNTVVEIQLNAAIMSPHKLMRHLQIFEVGRGRPIKRDPNAPRPLDLDLIYFGNLVVNEPGLIIPHPRAHLRRFVLEPLFHLRPELILPGQTQTVAELLQSLPTEPKGGEEAV